MHLKHGTGRRKMVTRKSRQIKLMRTLFWTLGVLVVALIAVLIINFATKGQDTSQQDLEQLYETAEYVPGVSIGGVDVSGMMFEEASTIPELLTMAGSATDGVEVIIDVNGTQYTYSPEELGITSNYSQVLEQAMRYGNEGSGSKIREERAAARDEGVDFPIGLYVDEEIVKDKIVELKAAIDVLPQDAALDIADDVLGPERFTYISEVKGVDVDAGQLAKLLKRNVEQGNYGPIEAPVIITNPAIDVATLKANTQLIGSYYSLFDSPTLSKEGRVNNIKLLADIVNGTVIKPGEAWSINEAAGPRDEQTAQTVGWTSAPGISNGRYEDQIGGGVCQVSSSVYNAAIRAELAIVQRRAHSWPSGYIENGMDATISTGGPDLVLSNPFDMPVYLAVYVEEEEYKVTVEVYGPPLTHGYKVQFVSNLVRTIPAGEPTYHYDSTTDPEGNPIAEGKTVTWVKEKDGQVWEVTKQYVDDNGNVVSSEIFSSNRYEAFSAVYYVNGPDPTTVGPTPLPTDSQ